MYIKYEQHSVIHLKYINSQGRRDKARRLISAVVPVGQKKRARTRSSKSDINHSNNVHNYPTVTHMTMIIIKTCLRWAS